MLCCVSKQGSYCCWRNRCSVVLKACKAFMIREARQGMIPPGSKWVIKFYEHEKEPHDFCGCECGEL